MALGAPFLSQEAFSLLAMGLVGLGWARLRRVRRLRPWHADPAQLVAPRATTAAGDAHLLEPRLRYRGPMRAARRSCRSDGRRT